MSEATFQRAKHVCLVCDDDDMSLPWSDLHAEAHCARCGTPYFLKKDGQWCPPFLAIREEALPDLRAYWRETKRPNGLGTFLGNHEADDQRDALVAWANARKATGATEGKDA